MNINRASISMLAIGSASLLVAGAAMAAPPGSFVYGAYHVGDVTAGTIDSGTVACPAATCVDLVQGTGLLQRQITLNTGEQYLQTIVVEDAATTGGVNAIVGGTVNLPFTNESFVGTNAQQGDLATQGTVDLIGTPAIGTAAQNRLTANIDQGGLASGGAIAKIEQVQTLDAVGGSMKFWLSSNVDETDRYMRMDQVVGAEGAGHPGAQGITVRKSSGSFTVQAGSDTLDLPTDAPGAGLAYASGDDIGTVWMQLRNFGGAGLNPSDERVFQMQNFSVNGTLSTWNSCNANGLGACNNVLAAGVTTWNYWDGNFGTAPNPMVGTANPAGNNFFPNFPD